jgi:hypothetical protein
MSMLKLLILAVLAAAAAGAGGYAAGVAAARADFAQAEAVRQAAETDRVRELQRAVGAGQARLRAAESAFTQHQAALVQEIRHARSAPLAACRGPAATPASPARPAAPAAGLADAAPPAAAGPGLQAPVAGPGVVFTGAAVRLWDSALAGQPVPRAGCTAADPAAPACAAATRVTLELALENHAINAALCAVDRARLTELNAAIHSIRGTAP